MATEPADQPSSDEEGGGPVKSFLEHLEDFRWTIVKCAVAIFVCVLICLLAGNYVVEILVWPVHRAVINNPGTNQIVTFYFGTNQLGKFNLQSSDEKLLALGTNRYAALDVVPVEIDSGTNHYRILALQQRTNTLQIEQNAKRMQMSLLALGPAEAFLVGFRIAIYAGIAMASPFLFYFLGQFILPALRVREKSWLIKGLAFAIPLFICGVLFCYFILMPAALSASQLYANWFGFDSNSWKASDYFDFICKFLLGMGLGFELPVVILLLVKIGIVDYALLKKARPYMVIINLVLGAVLTTPEVFTQVLMAVPLQLLFELSVLVAWYWERKARKAAKAAEGKMPPHKNPGD